MEILTPRQLLDRLVAFPSVSRDSNLDLVDWLEGYLTAHAIRCFRHWNEDRRKAALIAHAGPGNPAPSSCPAIPTWSPSMARPGPPTPGPSPNAMAAFTAAAPAT